MIIKTEKEFLEFVKREENNFSSPNSSDEFPKIIRLLSPYLIENAAIINSTFANSIRNLIGAKLLYKKGIKSSAVYHLQQAVELLIKWRAYISMDERSVRNNSHNMKNLIDKVFKKELENRNNIIMNINRAYTIKNGFGDFFSTVVFGPKFEEIKVVNYSKEEILNKRKKVINRILRECREFNKLINNLRKSPDFIIIKKHLDEIMQKRGAEPDDFNKFIKNLLNLFPTLVRLSYMSAFYGYITYPHQSYTRYSDKAIRPIDYENGSVGIAQPEVFI
ncbi:MAG: hypothetical protein ACYCSB_02105 [bacterium]